MKVYSPEAVRTADEQVILSGTSGAELIERAANGAFQVLRTAFPTPGKAAVVCGSGHNGGDGYALARLLALSGWRVKVFAAVPRNSLKGDDAHHAARLPANVEVCENDPGDEPFGDSDLIIDALLGTGFKAPLRPESVRWCERMNASGVWVCALDIPSGLSAADGTASPSAVRADLTVSFSRPKPGLFLKDGSRLCGCIRIADIGIPEGVMNAFEASEIGFYTLPDARSHLKRLNPFAYKGEQGHVGVAAGSALYGGAAALCAEAALTAGAGLVTVVTSEKNQAHFPNAVMQCRIPADEFGFMRLQTQMMYLIPPWKTAVVGPGLGRTPEAQDWVRYLVNTPERCTKFVLDADALHVAGQFKQLPSRREYILTPHAGEAQKLAASWKIVPPSDWNDTAERILFAGTLAQYANAVVVLKGPRSVIASPSGEISINGSGTPGLATAGSGDTLSGLIAGFWTNGLDAFEAACLGTFVHGFAAETFPGAQRALTADRLLAHLPAAMRQISVFA